MINSYTAPRKAKVESLTDYANKLFDLNKDRINKVLSVMNKRRLFVDSIIGRVEKGGYTVNQAVNEIFRSKSFTPVKERLAFNAIEGLKKHGVYQSFRNMTRDEKGRFTKVDVEKFRWSDKDKSYIYDNKVMITFTNSPEAIFLTSL